MTKARSLPAPTLPNPSQGVKTGNPGGPIKIEAALSCAVRDHFWDGRHCDKCHHGSWYGHSHAEADSKGRRGRMKKPAPLVEYAYDLAYGKDSAAQPGMVMLRIAKENQILCELNMPPEEFMQLAHAVEVVARAVDEDMQPQ